MSRGHVNVCILVLGMNTESKPAAGISTMFKMCMQVLANAPFSALYYTFYSSLQRRFQQVL